MEVTAFKVGDTVRLKSGGPLMTVTAIEKDDDGSQRIWTVWFDKGKENTGHYPAAAVQADDGTVHFA